MITIKNYQVNKPKKHNQSDVTRIPITRNSQRAADWRSKKHEKLLNEHIKENRKIRAGLPLHWR